jgi:hypothetical protein
MSFSRGWRVAGLVVAAVVVAVVLAEVVLDGVDHVPGAARGPPSPKLEPGYRT